jgi:hypothetical protein
MIVKLTCHFHTVTPQQDNENWNFNEIYLQVDSKNSNAQRLYIKQSKTETPLSKVHSAIILNLFFLLHQQPKCHTV